MVTVKLQYCFVVAGHNYCICRFTYMLVHVFAVIWATPILKQIWKWPIFNWSNVDPIFIMSMIKGLHLYINAAFICSGQIAPFNLHIDFVSRGCLYWSGKCIFVNTIYSCRGWCRNISQCIAEPHVDIISIFWDTGQCTA